MDALLNLIPGGSLTVILSSIAAGALALWRLAAVIRQSGVDKQKAKEAEIRAKNLDAIKRASDAGARVRPDDGLFNDPYNRDRRG